MAYARAGLKYRSVLRAKQGRRKVELEYAWHSAFITSSHSTKRWRFWAGGGCATRKENDGVIAGEERG